METWEDNIIKKKLEGMDMLPEGYTPNLESKWSMLEAGLDGNRKKVFLWKPYAAAAMLLMLGGSTLLLMRPKPKTAADIPSVIVPSIVAEKTSETNEQIVAIPKAISEDKVSRKKNMIAPAVITVVPIENNTPETTTVQQNQPIQEEQLIAAVPKTKKPRFVEVDFNDAPITAQKPSESVIAAQQFKFRIGINSVSSGGGQQKNAGSLRLQQSF